jgi:pimeloyl-ACP methyl ester carboxylesterase
MATKTILFVHGLFMTYRCWDAWVARFEARGYHTMALPYPGRDAPVEVLRRNHPDPSLGRLTLGQIVDSYEKAVIAMPEKPIIIGHSMGGLITQILLNRGLGAAGVAIDSAPPGGVLTTKWSFLKANWPMLNPFISGSTPHQMSFEQFQYAFVNGLPLADQRAHYDQQVVPESRHAARGALGKVAQIDFDRPRAPLLLLAGSTDNIIPASLNKTNYQKYQNCPSITDFKEFPGRTHYGMGQSGWEELADFVLGWIKKIGV